MITEIKLTRKEMIAKMRDWRDNDKEWSWHEEHRERWNRAIARVKGEKHPQPMNDAEIQRYVGRGWTRWKELWDYLHPVQEKKEPCYEKVEYSSKRCFLDLVEKDKAVLLNWDTIFIALIAATLGAGIGLVIAGSVC